MRIKLFTIGILALLLGSSAFGAFFSNKFTTNANPENVAWTNSSAGGIAGNGAGLTNLSSTFSDVLSKGSNAPVPVYSTSSTTNDPFPNEFPVAGWVRGLLVNGFLEYNSTNLAPGFVYGAQPFLFVPTIPVQFSRVYTAPTNNQYVGAVAITNQTQIQGPIVVGAYLGVSGGLGSRSMSVRPEIYYSYNNGTNLLGDWEVEPRALTLDQTNRYDWVVPVPATVSTGGVFTIYRVFKVISVTGSTRPNLVVMGGTNTPGQISFNTPAIQGSTYVGTFIGKGSGVTNVTAEAVASNSPITNATFYGVQKIFRGTSGVVSRIQDETAGASGFSMDFWDRTSGHSIVLNSTEIFAFYLSNMQLGSTRGYTTPYTVNRFYLQYANQAATSPGFSSKLIFMAGDSHDGGTTTHQTGAMIQGESGGTNYFVDGTYGNQGWTKLKFWSQEPFTGFSGKWVGNMETNGWNFRGRFIQQQVETTAAGLTAIDYDKASTLIFDAASNNITFYTTNSWASDTNTEPRTVVLKSGPYEFVTLSFPTNWRVSSVDGTGTFPTTLTNQAFLQMKLDTIGSGDSNVIVSFRTGAYPFIYDSDATNFFGRAGITNLTQKQSINDLVLDFKAAGIWTLKDAIYPYIGGNSNAHAMNLKSSSYPITFNAAVTHDANGITGNASSAYGDTTFNPATAGGQYAQDSCSVFIFGGTQTPTDATYFIGAVDGAGIYRCTLARSGIQFASTGPNNNTGALGITAAADWRGSAMIVRSNSTSGTIYVRGTLNRDGGTLGASTGLPNRSFYVLARNLSGSAASFTDANIRGTSIGAGLSDAQAAAEIAAWVKFQTTNGRNVP